MERFYVIQIDDALGNIVDAYLKRLRSSSMLMLAELAQNAPQGYYNVTPGKTAIYCTGVWVNQAIQSILTKEQVGRNLRYLALRNDGRILDCEFTAVVAPDKLKTRIV